MQTRMGYGLGLGMTRGMTAAGPLALNDLTDVTLTSPANGQDLVFDGSEWINQ